MVIINIIRNPVEIPWNINIIRKEECPVSWEKVFHESEHDLNDINEILERDKNNNIRCLPDQDDLFNALHYTKLQEVKVVILGQDPYHQLINVNGQSKPRATGLSFSVRREDTIPSSLLNIYKELLNTVTHFDKPLHGDLSKWAYQGVLLLNTSLTVRLGKPGSHGDIWHGFIKKVFKAISIVNPQCIFVLWGKEAQKMKHMLGEKSIILEASHPSGLSANRGFFGCNHFNIINNILVKQNKTPINWQLNITG